MTSGSWKTVAIAGGASLAAAAVWTVLAWRTPTSTFHFAPLVAAVVGPYVAKTRAGRQPLPTIVLTVAVCWVAVAVATTTLAIADRLRGPTFWSDDGALLEAILFALAGSTIGFSLLASARLRHDQERA